MMSSLASTVDGLVQGVVCRHSPQHPDDVLVATLLRAGAASEARELAWERLHSGRFDRCTSWVSVAFVVATLASTARLLSAGAASEALRLLDDALLLVGSPLPDAVATCTHELVRVAEQQQDDEEPGQQQLHKHHRHQDAEAAAAEQQREKPCRPQVAPGTSLRVIYNPSADVFQRVLDEGMPVIVRGRMAHWPAVHLWAADDFAYMRRVAGKRTVPVELASSLGHTYMDAAAGSWDQVHMTLGEFLDRHVLAAPAGSQVGYMAQHALLEQVPALRRDIVTPEFTRMGLADEADLEEEPAFNVWLGPGGTETPLHHDPRHNLLCQVSGSKFVILFDADDRGMYPAPPPLDHNSLVDFNCPDAARFPLFDQTRGFSGELRAGEMLYIPPLYWHFVRSLEPSCSVNCWWGKQRKMRSRTDGASSN